LGAVLLGAVLGAVPFIPWWAALISLVLCLAMIWVLAKKQA
jgi:hypothetical protein